MNKKITSSALAALMIAGSTSFSAFAAMANGTVVIGTKAFDLAYANNPANAAEITNLVVAGGAIYVKGFDGKWINNTTSAVVDASVIPAVTYKSATGVVSSFDAKDVDAVKLPQIAVSASTTKSLKVTFDKAVDTTKATFSVKSGNVVVNVVPTWSADAKEATLTSSIALAAGDYSVTVGGLGIEAGKDTVNTVVAPERINTITLDAAAYKVASTTNATIGYKLLNQYGEDITKTINTSTLVVTSSKGTSASATAQGTITIVGLGATDTSSVVTIVDTTFAKTATATVNVAETKAISELTLGTVAVKTGKTNLEAGVTGYELSYTAKDQYGNAVKLTAADLSKLTFVSSDATVFAPTSVGLTTATDNKLTVDFGAFNGLKNVSITAIVNATGKSSSTTATVYGTATADVPTLVAPSTRFGLGDTAYQVELAMKDQYGNAMKAADILSAAAGLTITSGNTSVFNTNATKVVVVGEKAYVQVDAVAKGTANLTVTVNATGKSVTVPLTVVDAKVASSMVLVPDYTYAVSGGSVVLKATFKDQYGDALTTSSNLVKFTADNTDFTATAPVNTSVTNMKSTGVTLVAAAADKATTYTAKLYAADGTTVLDTQTVKLTSVKADAALTYAITDLGTIAAKSMTDATYEGTVTVYAKDASGNKVALIGSEIQAVTSSDAKLDATALLSKKIKAAAVDTDGVANFNVIVNTNTGIKTFAGTVAFSKVAPSASKIEVKAGTTLITKATVTNGTIDLSANTLVKFVVTDQYGKTALTVPSYVAVFVTDKTSGVLVASTTLTSWTATAGTYIVTAVTANGLTSTVEVTVQ